MGGIGCVEMVEIVLNGWEFGRRTCKDSINHVGFVRLGIGQAVYELRFWTREVRRTFTNGAMNKF